MCFGVLLGSNVRARARITVSTRPRRPCPLLSRGKVSFQSDSGINTSKAKPARMPSRTGRKLSECLNGIDVEKRFLFCGEAGPHSCASPSRRHRLCALVSSLVPMPGCEQGEQSLHGRDGHAPFFRAAILKALGGAPSYIIVGASRRVSESHAHLQVLICALCRICGSIALAEFLQLAGEGFEVGAADGDAKQGGELAQIPYPADRFLQAFKP